MTSIALILAEVDSEALTEAVISNTDLLEELEAASEVVKIDLSERKDNSDKKEDLTERRDLIEKKDTEKRDHSEKNKDLIEVVWSSKIDPSEAAVDSEEVAAEMSKDLKEDSMKKDL